MEKPLLRSCEACGKEISRHSAFCRHCGHPQKLPLIMWLLVLFLLMMVAFYLAFCIYCMLNVQGLRVMQQALADSAYGTQHSMSHATVHVFPLPCVGPIVAVCRNRLSGNASIAPPSLDRPKD
ncbi:MAG: hypothetical protein R6V12_04445 [Candidatus Hydrogenedentota bacterium]